MEKKSLELSLKSIVIGLVLAVLLCGANMYLGLKIGSTIAASIPASIISLGILRLFKKYSILENNIAQTIASSGEAIAGVIVYVFPALIILGVWKSFSYWDIFFIGVCGGIIGITYSVLLRKVLLNDKNLSFPEGNAIGQVMIATNSSNDRSSFKIIMSGITVSALINFCTTGLQILSDSYYKFFKIGIGVIGLGTAFSTATIGAGYLIGASNITAFISLLFGWLILLPYFAMVHGIKDVNNLSTSAFTIWSLYVRPVGIGVFLFSGVATILMMSKTIFIAVGESIKALKNIDQVDHYERDLSLKKLFFLSIIAFIPIFIFIYYQLFSMAIFSLHLALIYSAIISIVVLILGFILAGVAGYIVGLVGSSNSPISGLFFIAVIILSLIIKILVGANLNINLLKIYGIIIMLIAFIGFSAIITNENIQDFKSGSMVGAAPYKQQISLFIGVIVAMFFAPLMINLIFNAYGIAGITPHAGIDPHNTLSAPQASAIAMITKNVLNSTQDWNLLLFGLAIGAIAMIINLIGKRTHKFNFPPIMVALGLYLAPSLITALFIGGILNMIISHKQKKLIPQIGKDKVEKLRTKTNILICGLIAGESLMGLFLSIPFVIKQSSDALKIVGNNYNGTYLSFAVFIMIILIVYRFGTNKKIN